MTAMSQHPSYAGRLVAQSSEQPPGAPAIESIPHAELAELASADHSSCCIAKPAVVAFIPAGPGRTTQADLLLCMHHYRASWQKLADIGAKVLDATGAVLTKCEPW